MTDMLEKLIVDQRTVVVVMSICTKNKTSPLIFIAVGGQLLNCSAAMLRVYFTLGRCDQFKVLVLGAHAYDHIYLLQGQPDGILFLGPTQHVDRKHLTGRGDGYTTQENQADI